MDIQCKIINKWDCNTRKICFSKIRNFHFHYVKFLKLHLLEILKLLGFAGKKKYFLVFTSI